MAKTNWTMQDVVKPDDLNLLGVEINEVVDLANEAETPAGAQVKADVAEQNAKEYTDTSIGEIVIPTPPVTSVLGRTGDVVASAGDYSADQITETNINKIMTSTERTKLAGIESGAQVNEVNSVNSKTGAVTLDKTDVGLSNVDNFKQATKTEFDAHTSDQSSHGATSTPTANRIAMYDADGSLIVGVPSNPAHAARKQDLDNVTAQLEDVLHKGVSDSNIFNLVTMVNKVDTRSITVERLDGLIKAIEEKDGSSVIRRTEIVRNQGIISEVLQFCDGKVITHYLSRGADAKITQVIKSVV